MTREEKLKLYSLDDTMGAGGVVSRKVSKEEWELTGKIIEELRQQHYANLNKTKKIVYA